MMSVPLETVETSLFGEKIVVDRQFAYDILTAISELHGRLCTKIGDCGDMEEATKIAARLENLCHLYNDAEGLAATIDNRDRRPLEV